MDNEHELTAAQLDRDDAARDTASAWLTVRSRYLTPEATTDLHDVTLWMALDALAIKHGLLKVNPQLPTQDLVVHMPGSRCPIEGMHPTTDCP